MSIINVEIMKIIDERERCDTKCVVMRWGVINDTHMEKLALYSKNLLKYKVGSFSRFSYVYTIN